MMTKKHALELIEKIRSGLKITTEGVREIVVGQGWVPLGYENFTQMWEAEFADVPLAHEVRAAVIFVMFDEGASPAEVADAMHGVGEAIAESVREQKENGVPTEAVSLSPRRRRGPNTRRAYDRHIDIMVTEAEYEAIAAIAGESCTVTDWALALIREAIAESDAEEAV